MNFYKTHLDSYICAAICSACSLDFLGYSVDLYTVIQIQTFKYVSSDNLCT